MKECGRAASFAFDTQYTLIILQIAAQLHFLPAEGKQCKVSLVSPFMLQMIMPDGPRSAGALYPLRFDFVAFAGAQHTEAYANRITSNQATASTYVQLAHPLEPSALAAAASTWL